MKYALAIAACFGIFCLYVIVFNGILGAKGTGGVIPMLILMAAWVGTWKAITKEKEDEKSP